MKEKEERKSNRKGGSTQLVNNREAGIVETEEEKCRIAQKKENEVGPSAEQIRSDNRQQ